MGRRRAKRARTQGQQDDEPTCSGRRARVCRGDWANLTAGPAGQIAELLLSHSVADYLRFRAVCAAWRACTDDPRAHGVLDSCGWRFHPRRWIMFPVPFHFGSRRPFLDVSTGESIHVRIPDLYGRHHLFASTSEGLIVMSRQDTFAVQLLNPLTGQRSADLPRVTALLVNYKGSASVPRSRLKDFGVGSAGLAGDSMVALDYGFGSGIAVARPGDKFWTRLRFNGTFKSAMSFEGRFYCATSRNILVVETTANRRPQLAVAVDFGPGSAFPYYCSYDDELQLVDNGGELILVHVVCHGYPGSNIFSYKTYRVRLDTRSIEPMHGLCGRALFMGTSRSLSMRAKVSRFMSEDTVYKCRDYNIVSGRPNCVVAIDLLGGCFRPQFHKHKDDIAHYVSCYVSS